MKLTSDHLCSDARWAKNPPVLVQENQRTEANDYKRPPQHAGLYTSLQTLWSYRELLCMWSLREIKIRYKQSLLGAAWAVFQPLGLMVVFTVVFSLLARVPTGAIPYPVFSYAALLPWTFLSTSVAFAVPSMITNMQLISKIYFPREILPLGSVLASLLDFLVASLVFGVLLFYYQISLTVYALWIPVLVLIQISLTGGIVLFLSAVTVKYRDIRFVVPLVMQIWMYASPVIYPSSLVPERFRFYFNLNPMAGLIESYRCAIITGVAPSLFTVVSTGVISIVLLIAGYLYFKREESAFADII